MTLRWDPAALASARRRRALLAVLVLSLVGSLAGAPFVLAGCYTPVQGDPFNAVRNVDASFDGTSRTIGATGTATGLLDPIVDKVTVGVVAPTGVTPTPPVVTRNGLPVGVTAAVSPTATAVIDAELQGAGVYSPPNEVLFFFETVDPLTIANGDQFSISVQQNPAGPMTTSNRLGAGGMLRSDIDDGPPYFTLQYVDNPVAFVAGGNPGLPPTGAAAWKTLNLAVGHSDGPFALPGQPNPNDLQVLDPLQIATLGPLWANPDACPHIHAHGFYGAPPPHSDPQPPVCGHGALVYLPHLTASLLFPPDGSFVLGGGHTTLTASPTTTGFGIDRVEYVVGEELVGSATSPPWEFVYTPSAVTGTTSYPWFARVFDHNGATATSEVFDLTLVAPLELNVAYPPPVIVAGFPVTFTVDLSGGLPPLAADLEIDDVLFDSQTGSPPFLLSWVAPPTATAYPIVARVIGRDSVTYTATPYIPLSVAPQIGGTLSLSRSVVVAGDPVTITVDLVGYPPYSVTFLADEMPFETQVGSGPSFAATFTPPLDPATQVYQLRASALDGVPQSVTLTATALTAVGTAAPPFIQITEPLAGLQVAEGSVVTIRADVVGGVGGVPRVDFTGNDEPIGSDTNPGNGYSIQWVADRGLGVTVTPFAVDLRGIAEDAFGQLGSSEPVEILVMGAIEVPALGGAALGALVALLTGVGVHAALRRRRRD